MVTFIKTWGALIIATIALFQLWAIAFYKRYVRKGLIKIHETGSIEVGYSLLGPTIGLRGTLRAIGKEVFIRDIELSIIRLRDKSTHIFDWAMLGPEKITIGNTDGISFKPPYAFMLPVSQPYRYYITFADVNMQSEIMPVMEKFLVEWNEARMNIDIVSLQELDGILEGVGQLIQKKLQELYREFSQRETHVSTFDFLNRHCYWESGKYELEMKVKTDDPDRIFSENWQFELSENDAKKLRLNALTILQQSCGQYPDLYNFAYAKYQKWV